MGPSLLRNYACLGTYRRMFCRMDECNGGAASLDQSQAPNPFQRGVSHPGGQSRCMTAVDGVSCPPVDRLVIAAQDLLRAGQASSVGRCSIGFTDVTDAC